jgi:hypothetical protein
MVTIKIHIEMKLQGGILMSRSSCFCHWVTHSISGLHSSSEADLVTSILLARSSGS